MILAAQAIAGVAGRSPASTWESNVRGTWNVLGACGGLGEAGPRDRPPVARLDGDS